MQNLSLNEDHWIVRDARDRGGSFLAAHPRVGECWHMHSGDRLKALVTRSTTASDGFRVRVYETDGQPTPGASYDSEPGA